MQFLLFLFLLQTPESVLTKLGIDQALGTQVAPEIAFRDENGNTVKLGDFFGSRPIILTPIYFECPMLCSMQLNGLVRAMRVMPFTAGKEFEIISFSIDPNEKPELASAKKEQYLHDYGKVQARTGWHFLTGDAASIERLTDNIGFRYYYDAAIKQWAHSSALIVLTPTGRISQYFYGIEYDPGDLKYSLIEASEGKIGTFIDHALLFCFQYDPTKGKYSLAIMRGVRIAGILMMVGILAFWSVSHWERIAREKRASGGLISRRNWRPSPGVSRVRK